MYTGEKFEGNNKYGQYRMDSVNQFIRSEVKTYFEPSCLEDVEHLHLIRLKHPEN